VRFPPYAAIAFALVAVSFSSIFIRWSDSPPLVIAAYRLLFATAVLLPFALAWHWKELRSLPRKDVLVMAGIGLLLGAHFGLWISSLKVQGVSVTSSVVLVTSHPILVGALSHLVLKERIGRMTAAGIAVGIVGVTLIGIGDFGLSATTLGGDILALLGGVMVGLYLLAGRHFRQRVSVLVYVLVVYASAAALLTVAAVATGGMQPAGDVGREFMLFLLLALVSQIGGHTVYNWCLKYVTAPVVSVSFVGEPVGAAILALLLLGEKPSDLVILGAIAALAGIYLTARGQLKMGQSNEKRVKAR